MTNQLATINKNIEYLAQRNYINKTVLKIFQNRLIGDARLTRDENVTSHFCALFTPICVKEQKIYIGHHIKSDSWLSPGGHIDTGESPLDTVTRECSEELGYTIKNELVELFHILHFDIENRPTCTEHYDFWYLILFDSLKTFQIDTHEFSEAGWFTIDEALKKKSLPEFKNELKLLKEYIEYN